MDHNTKPAISMETQHVHPGGTHTVLVCVPGRYVYGPQLLTALETQLANAGLTYDAPLADLTCHRHLNGHIFGDDTWPPATCAQRPELVQHRPGVQSHMLAGVRAGLMIAAATKTVRANLPPHVKARHLLQPISEARLAALREHPLTQAMLAAEPGLAHTATELFGIGLVALSYGREAFWTYAGLTSMYGHALVTADGKVMRSGPGRPDRDSLLGRLAYALRAALYLRWLTDATVFSLHLTLPDNPTPR